MESINLDDYLDSIRTESPPYVCPFEDCEKNFRKVNLMQTHLQSDHHSQNGSDKLKGRLRKTPFLHDEEMAVEDAVRKVYFKYEDQFETISVSTKMRTVVNNSSTSSSVQGENSLTIDSNKCKRTKAKNKGGKSKASSNEAIYIGNLNLKLPEVKFNKKNSHDVYHEPPDANSAYYRYYEDPDEDDHSKVEYDMDEEDYIWLEVQNENRKSERLLDVDADAFEFLMDRLEKESYFQSQHTGNDPSQTIDEDAVCCICNDGECHNSNAILFCDMCNLAVHQECYGVPYIPEGQWLCRRCMQSPSRAVDCVLCPNKSGAFKQTDDNRWAHVICALWIPEVCFANTVFLEPIDSLRAIPPARWKLLCSICHKRGSGACIQCHKSNCYVAFHVTCAQHAGFYMKIEVVKSNQVANTSYVRKTAYCEQHAPEIKNGHSNGIYSSGEEDSKHESKNSKTKSKSNKKIRRNTSERNIPRPIVSIPTIPGEKLTEIASLRNFSFPRRNDFLAHLYAYWKLKRQSRNGAPLLRRLQNSHSVMRIDLTKDKSKRDSIRFNNAHRRLIRMRQDLERARLLMEDMKKREKAKVALTKENKLCRIYQLSPFKQFLSYILGKVSQVDHDGYFQAPVTEMEAPFYFEIISRPMDLGTMRKRVENHEYTSFEDFENDLYQIVTNCTTYNKEDTVYYKAALKLKNTIDQVLANCRQYVSDYDQKAGLLLETISNCEML